MSELSDFAVLLGVDYVDRAYGDSITKVKSFFGAWRTIKDETLSNIENHGQVGTKRSRAAIPDYTPSFARASNIFHSLLVLLSCQLLSGNHCAKPSGKGIILLREAIFVQLTVSLMKQLYSV